MNISIPRFVLKPACVLSMGAFVACLIVAVSPFIGLFGVFREAMLPLVAGIFPLHLGSVVLMINRRTGPYVKSWVPILLAGLPKWFLVTYQIYSVLVGLTALAAFAQAVRGQVAWLGLLWVLIPSVFYATSIGAYWSEIRISRRDTEKAGPVPQDKGSTAREVGPSDAR